MQDLVKPIDFSALDVEEVQVQNKDGRSIFGEGDAIEQEQSETFLTNDRWKELILDPVSPFPESNVPPGLSNISSPFSEMSRTPSSQCSTFDSRNGSRKSTPSRPSPAPQKTQAKSEKDVNGREVIVIDSSDDEIEPSAPSHTFISVPNGEAKPCIKLKMEDMSIDMSAAEEKKDPELAKILRMSAFEAYQRKLLVEESPETKSAKNKTRVPNSKTKSTQGNGDEVAYNYSLRGKGKQIVTVAQQEAFYTMLDPSTRSSDSSTAARSGSITAFARGETDISVEEMIKELGMSDLASIAKDLKCWKSKYSKPEVIEALLNTASRQSRLSFVTMGNSTRPGALISRRANTESALPETQTKLPFLVKRSASSSMPKKTPTPWKPSPSIKGAGKSLLYAKVLEKYQGRALQVTIPLRELIWRVNLVYYRSSIMPQGGKAKSLMLPEILKSSSKRSYPTVKTARSTIWPTREALLEYERALELEAIVDEALGEQNHSSGTWIGPSGYGFGSKGGRLEGAKRVKKVWMGVFDKWKMEVKKAQDAGVKQTGTKHVLDRFALGESLVTSTFFFFYYPKSYGISSKKLPANTCRPTNGQSFLAGHILTRLVSKGATALGILHEYDVERDVLEALLSQKVWRRGKRGAWYDRLALVLMHHYNGDVPKKEQAVNVCIDALEDPDTHLIYRPRLSRRLRRLEKQLQLPPEQCHICEAVLDQSKDRTIVAERVSKPHVAKAGYPKQDDKEEEEEEEEGQGSMSMSLSGKSWWQGRSELVSVEQRVIEWWEDRGYKGYHSESSILTTLFGILFWPVLFADIPGAFETPYQLAPLDLGDDSFYQSRKELIESRLDRMQNTSQALIMLGEIDDQERPHGTLAIGVRWDYPKKDLEEIVQCMGGKSLSVICRMFCEEYGHRASGVPDLIVWNTVADAAGEKEGKCRLVEVKSPNDRLSETQKVWISVLLSAGIDVEVCHVAEASTDSRINTKSKVAAVATSSKKRKLNGNTKNNTRNSNGNGWGRQRNYDYGSMKEESDEEDGGGDEDEYKYESGEEGGNGRKRRGGGGLMSRAEAESGSEDKST